MKLTWNGGRMKVRIEGNELEGVEAGRGAQGRCAASNRRSRNGSNPGVAVRVPSTTSTTVKFETVTAWQRKFPYVLGP